MSLSEPLWTIGAWRRIIDENKAAGRPWYYGLPYTWWWGMTESQFLAALPSHLPLIEVGDRIGDPAPSNIADFVSDIKGDDWDEERDNLKQIGESISHNTDIFPVARPGAVISLISPVAPNTWSAWARLDDGIGNFFDTLFTREGKVAALGVESLTAAGKYELEVAETINGDPANLEDVAKLRLGSSTVGILTQALIYRIRGNTIRAGEQVYGRCMCSVGGPQTLGLHIRYFLE